MLNNPITIIETIRVIKFLPKNKTPGKDGLSGEYYQAFTEILSSHLTKMFNQVANNNQYPKEMLEALIITLPKPNKDPTAPSYFRPISLLNLDIKIYVKNLANSLLNITYLIGADQVGFVKRRQAQDGTRGIVHLLNYIENSHTPAIFLALDAEKAFDRVHWQFISQTLEKFWYQGIYSFRHYVLILTTLSHSILLGKTLQKL